MSDTQDSGIFSPNTSNSSYESEIEPEIIKKNQNEKKDKKENEKKIQLNMNFIKHSVVQPLVYLQLKTKSCIITIPMVKWEKDMCVTKKKTNGVKCNAAVYILPDGKCVRAPKAFSHVVHENHAIGNWM